MNATKAIDSTKWDVLRYIPYNMVGDARKVLESKVNALFDELGPLNKYNFEAHLPICNVDMGARQTNWGELSYGCLLYTSPSPRDRQKARMPSSA